MQITLSKHYKLIFRPAFFVLCLTFTCLMCWLGVWQLHRYHFKKNLLETYQQRLIAAPIPLVDVKDSANNWQFQPVWTMGLYRNDLTMLVQNQFHDDKVGFDVITPVEIAGDKRLLLVDRGWVPQESMTSLPHVSEVNGEQKVVGNVKLVNEYQFILGNNILNPAASPIVMQKMDITELSRVTHLAFFPFVLRLSPTANAGFVREWTITTVMPERHMAYAVQWFAMALTLLIAYFCFCFEKRRGNDGAN